MIFVSPSIEAYMPMRYRHIRVTESVYRKKDPLDEAREELTQLYRVPCVERDYDRIRLVTAKISRMVKGRRTGLWDIEKEIGIGM